MWFWGWAKVGGNLLGLLGLIKTIVSQLLPILVALSLVVFIWGLISYVISADEEARKDGKQRMMWGIIALFVIVSIWGIVTYISDILGISKVSTVTPPSVGGL